MRTKTAIPIRLRICELVRLLEYVKYAQQPNAPYVGGPNTNEKSIIHEGIWDLDFDEKTYTTN